jgi:hypothetical protein
MRGVWQVISTLLFIFFVFSSVDSLDCPGAGPVLATPRDVLVLAEAVYTVTDPPSVIRKTSPASPWGRSARSGLHHSLPAVHPDEPATVLSAGELGLLSRRNRARGSPYATSATVRLGHQTH